MTTDAMTLEELKYVQQQVGQLVTWLMTRKWSPTIEVQQMHVKLVEFHEWANVKFAEDNRTDPSLEMDVKNVEVKKEQTNH